ncbi:MAG: hypothetical protein ACOCV8_02810 [Spirochaetota bacterium]
MNKIFKIVKKNWITLTIAIGVIIAIIVSLTLLTDLNPISMGSLVGLAVGLIAWGVIYRMHINEEEKKSDK